MLGADLTDEQITHLIKVSKLVSNPKARDKTKDLTIVRNYELTAQGNLIFSVFLRVHSEMEDNFSAGLLWHPGGLSGGSVVLMRCNGSSHRHKNHIEGDSFSYSCHIHIATQRYLSRGKASQSYAEVTAEYFTAKGALHELVKRCSISGIETEPDQTDLFRGAIQ